MLILHSLERDEVRQKKLGRTLEWDQDKPTLDADGSCSPRIELITDALPRNQRYYVNYSRRGRGNNFEGRGRVGRFRPGTPRGHDRGSYADRQNQQHPSSIDDQAYWPALPTTRDDEL